MKIVIAGGSGLVGRALSRSLIEDGAEVVVLSRDAERRDKELPEAVSVVDWSGPDTRAVVAAIDGAEAVVNVAGARVAPWPWTKRRKRTIEASRVESVRVLVDAMAQLSADRRPARLIVVSGIDAYPESPPGDDPPPLTEASPLGTEFLARVSRSVEDEAVRAEALGVRVIRLRMGHVLARDADLVWYLALPVRLFLGGRLGSGRQWLSWVHIDDAVGLFRLAMTDAVAGGVLDVTSPGAVRQVDFVRSMARVLRRPAWFPAPAWLIRMVLGEQSVLLLGSRRVAPARATELGYAFRYPTIDAALGDVLG